MTTRLTAIKIIHTLIWLFFNIVLGYMAYAVSMNHIDIWVWLGITLILVEGLVLVIFRGTCPLTIIARKHSDSTQSNFDIYLPQWLAKYTKIIYTIIFALIISLLIFRLLKNIS